MEFNRSELISDVELYLETFAREYVKDAPEKFTEAAKKTIVDVFYGAYSPDYYHRTDDLANNSAYKYYKDNGSSFYGGVIIGDRDMSDYSNNWFGQSSVTPASSVVSWTWRSGYHGYKNGNPGDAIHTFPPLAALEMEIGTITDQLLDNAATAARSQPYSVLMF